MLQSLLNSLWLVPIYSLVGAVLSLIWVPSITRRTGPRPAGYINILMTLVSFLHGVGALVVVWGRSPLYWEVEWFRVAGLAFTLPVEFSTLTVGAIVLVTGLNLLAQVYAVGYMEMDWGWARFYALLAFFESGMCALVLCGSLFFSYVILETLTLGTYLLVGVWYNQALVVTGARDAFLTKRAGDLILLMGVVALLPLAGTWNFNELADWARSGTADPTALAWVGLALLAGPVGKCAQFPLHLWLDEAMESPLPSSILRLSVVVSTGAWVLIRLLPLLDASPVVQSVAIAIGAATALGTSLIAIAQIDLKRILSYTVSAYMGLVFVAVATRNESAALLLVMTHGLAIALVVMAAGSIISNCITQDLTQLGGLLLRRPVTAFAMAVGITGLVGVPPLGTSWIFQELVSQLWYEQRGLAILILLVNGLTAFSMARLFWLTFGGAPKQMTARSPEPIWLIVLPMMVLSGVVLHVPHLFWQWRVVQDWGVFTQHSGIAVIVSSLLGLGLGTLWFRRSRSGEPLVPWLVPLQSFLAYDFYTVKLYRYSFVWLVDRFSRLVDWGDRYIIDGIGNFFGVATLFSGESIKYTTFGQLQFYVLTIVGGILLLLLFVNP
ncbi:MAG: NAD(P)H-quinone oxidoreductase subunit F [Oscillatoriales cyanobacterium SM2_2_1]|nr:NAD(P)H-quinone oxidoreductase subunit F [Oscillatoriales cyanobacterium SM2_2_1]